MESPEASLYDLYSVKMPRLAGSQLRLLIRLVENPITKGALINRLLTNGGIMGIRQLKIDDPPTFQPPSANQVFEMSQAGVKQDDIEHLVGKISGLQRGFEFTTIRDYAEAYRSGKITPEEVAERFFEAVESSEAHSPPMKFFIAIHREDVLTQARQSTRRYQEKQPISLLDGVPVAVKDEFDMIPYPTTVGTRFLGTSNVAQDATIVARLRSCGALLLGKTNMHEIGIGVTGLNPHHGTVRNPYEPGYHTGGSSSGPAAAVGAGLCPLAIGADGGGSIRIPSAYCGVVGLKPTFGRLSEFGAAPLCWSVAHTGPIAATPVDAAIGYALMAGVDPYDPNTSRQPEVTLEGFNRSDLRDLKIGVYWPWFRHATAEVVSACEKLVVDFQELGAELIQINLPELELARVAHLIIISSEINTALGRYHQEHRKDYGLEARLNLSLARAMKPQDYIISQRIRTRTIDHFQRALAKVDVILSPASAITAPPIKPDALPDGESDLTVLTEIMRFATPANLTGHPAISFPAGYDSNGLPIGLQVIGRYWQEHILLRMANVAARLVERREPKVFYKLLM